MNSRFFGTLGALAAATFVACTEDPLDSLRGGVSNISVNPNPIFISENATGQVTVTARDEQLNPIATAVTAAPADPNVISVASDPDANPDPTGTTHRFRITPQSRGTSLINLSAGGTSAQGNVYVVPAVFDGTISTVTPTGGDTMTIAGTDTLIFDPAAVSVTFAGGEEATVLSATAELVTILTPFATAGPVTVGGVSILYVPNRLYSLTSALTITQTGDLWPGDDAIGTAPSLPVPAPGETAQVLTNVTTVDNSASCPEVVLAFGSSGPCMIYEFTLAEDTELTFEVDWSGTADIDIYVCPDADPANCFEDGGGGATAAHPEETTALFTAGTHYLFVEIYAPPNPKNIYITISRAEAPPPP